MPDERLSAAASFVRQGAVLADVGTDHALLPVFLCESGKIERAYATDIAQGPLEAARLQIEESGLEGRVIPVLTDGLSGLEDKGITDVTVCGMGGELIAAIIERAPFVKREEVRLILQPMTRQADLRLYLAENGFSVEEEAVVSAKGKCYFCLVAHYTGEGRVLSRIEAELGSLMYQSPKNPLFLDFVTAKVKAQEKKVKGLEKAASLLELTEEKAYLKELLAYLERSSHE